MRLPTKVGVVMMLSVNDVSPGAMVKSIYALTEAAIGDVYSKSAEKNESKAAATDADSADSKAQLSDYEGAYFVPNYDNDSYIGVDQDGLFSISIFDNDPAENIQTWVHNEGDVFKRKRKDNTLAESITFERNSKGQVVSVVQHGYRSMKR
jgi:hypothetical protein